MPRGDPRAEYFDASANVRHFQTVRFAQLTIFIAITGGLVSILFRQSESMSTRAAVFIKIAGIMATTLYRVRQERTMTYWRQFLNRAAELEKKIGFRQYSTRPKPRLRTGANAMKFFSLPLILLWICTHAWPP